MTRFVLSPFVETTAASAWSIPARAEFYASRGLRTVCPTETAISVLLDTVRETTRVPEVAS